QKCGILLRETFASAGVDEEGGDVDPVGAVEIVDQGKDFGAGVLRFQKRHHLGIDGVNGAALNHIEKVVGFGINALKVAVGGKHVQPFRIQQIDLPRVLPQRRKAGRIPGNIERAANTFVNVQFNLRGSNI